MGKAIGSLEKNKICAGTPNEEPIKERVSAIKDAWHKSVKARKDKPKPKETSGTPPVKRELDTSATSESSAPLPKKAKVDDSKKSFSSLMQKMSSTSKTPISSTGETATKTTIQKKQTKKRVKWKDHFGGNLTKSRILEDGDAAIDAQDQTEVSWSDRKKRDRLREKELLAKAK
jgi:hypothetical protein